MAEPKYQWEDVPAGTKGRRCRAESCGAMIFDVRRPSKKDPTKIISMPVDCDMPGARHPTADAAGLGVNHFQTCTEPGKF
jgi:hypothetical protein